MNFFLCFIVIFMLWQPSSWLGCLGVLVCSIILKPVMFGPGKKKPEVMVPEIKDPSDEEPTEQELHDLVSELTDTVRKLRLQLAASRQISAKAYKNGFDQGQAEARTMYGGGNLTVSAGTTFRNVMLMHHNARQTDESYKASRLYEQTEASIKSLNVYLDKK